MRTKNNKELIKLILLKSKQLCKSIRNTLRHTMGGQRKVSRMNLSQLITELEKLPQEEREQARKFIPLMILQMRDEDLDKLDRDFKGKERVYVLMAMLLFPKERWEELGIPEYLREYEIADDEEED